MKKISKYDTSALPEAQFEPGSRGCVLKNRLGIKRKKEMDEADMAFQAGLPMLNFKDITDRKRKEHLAAINRGLSRDYKPMERIFERIIERSIKSKSV